MATAKKHESTSVETAEDPFAAVLETPIATFERVGTASGGKPRKPIPESISTIMELSYAEYFTEVKADGKTLKANTSKYRHFKLPNEKLAKEFVSHVKRWAKYRTPEQCSVRCFQLDNDPTTVRFAAMPLIKKETRRLPGTEK